MILVGLNYRWLNCVGACKEEKTFFEAQDIHEAAKETFKSTWSSGFQVQTVVGGEFHDTETGKTWSVDANGHTKQDYRRERDSVFRKRWEGGIE